ncbi:MAG: flagellar basal body-associated FliL family protein, partial [Verrucomicrobiota bacterium]|nr:flagellar basal body-associated FliL family protein [Verrucomicrobiota bacterium]
DFPRGKNQTVRLANTNQNLAKKYNVSGFPTVILLDGNGKELAREVGLAHQNPAQMIAWLKAKGGGNSHGHAHGDDDAHGDDGHGDDAGAGGASDDGAAEGDAHEETSPVKADDPEELVAIVEPGYEAAPNRSVVANPKGSQGNRYILAEVYMQRREPGDTGFKARAQKKTKLLQAIVSSELESRTVEELQQTATKESIRQNLQKQFNNVLKTPGSPAPVGKIIFSKWIMQ